jgi:hypothetical protein
MLGGKVCCEASIDSILPFRSSFKGRHARVLGTAGDEASMSVKCLGKINGDISNSVKGSSRGPKTGDVVAGHVVVVQVEDRGS